MTKLNRKNVISDFVESVEEYLESGGTYIGGKLCVGLSPSELGPVWKETLIQLNENGLIAASSIENWTCPTVDELLAAGLTQPAQRDRPQSN
jgi:hypothetical protein